MAEVNERHSAIADRHVRVAELTYERMVEQERRNLQLQQFQREATVAGRA
jgi:hypothetical protein